MILFIFSLIFLLIFSLHASLHTMELTYNLPGMIASENSKEEKNNFERKASDQRFRELPPQPGISARNDRRAQLQHTPYPADQYAQAPDYHALLNAQYESNETQHNKHPRREQQQEIQLETHKDSQKAKCLILKNDPILEIVTPTREIQYLIKAYAVEPADYERAFNYLVNLSTDARDLFNYNQIAISPDEQLMGGRCGWYSQGDVKILTTAGKPFNSTFPYYYKNLQYTEKRPCQKYCCSNGQLYGGCLAATTGTILVSTKTYGTTLCFTLSVGSVTAGILFMGVGCLHKSNNPETKATALAFHPNGTIILGSYIIDNCLNSDRCFLRCRSQNIYTLEIWKRDGTLQKTIKGAHTQPITAIAVADDGKIITGSRDTTVKLWNGNTPLVLTGHTAAITSIETNGNIIVTAAADNVIKLWNYSGTCIQTISYNPLRLTATKLCADGSLITSVTDQAIGSNIPRCVVSHFNPTTHCEVKKTIPYDITVLLQLTNKTVLIGTRDGTLFTLDIKSDTAKKLKEYNSSIISLKQLTSGIIAVGIYHLPSARDKSSSVEFLMPEHDAHDLLCSCSLEQLDFIQQLIKQAKEMERLVLTHKDTELFLSLPAYIQKTLQINYPHMLMRKLCCGVSVCCL